MNTWLTKLGLKFIAKRMDGYKSYSGAVGKILAGVASVITGVAGLIVYMFPEQGAEPPNLEVQMGMIGGGFYAIASGIQGVGIAHKIEKSQAK